MVLLWADEGEMQTVESQSSILSEVQLIVHFDTFEDVCQCHALQLGADFGGLSQWLWARKQWDTHEGSLQELESTVGNTCLDLLRSSHQDLTKTRNTKSHVHV